MKPTDQAIAWFEDPVLIRSFPVHIRAYAAYSRVMWSRRRGTVLGGSFLLRLARHLTPLFRLPREARATVAGRVVWVDLTDTRFLWVLDEVRGLGHEHRVMRSLLKPGDTFLDVGANHGSFGILASHLVGPKGMVIAVEPQLRIAALMHRSLAQAPAPFEVHPVALGERDTEGILYVPYDGSGAASLAVPVRRDASAVPVRVRRADDLPDWRGWPGSLLVKLDVEGSEPEFLNGARAMIEARRPVILFELSAVQLRSAGHEPDQLIQRFQDMGYRRFAEIDRYPDVSSGSLDLERQRNLLALP